MADVVEIDAATGEAVERGFTPGELAQREVDAAEVARVETERQARAAERAALLERLGISEEEALLLIGGPL